MVANLYISKNLHVHTSIYVKEQKRRRIYFFETTGKMLCLFSLKQQIYSTFNISHVDDTREVLRMFVKNNFCANFCFYTKLSHNGGEIETFVYCVTCLLVPPTDC